MRAREISGGKGKPPNGEKDLQRSNEQQDIGKHQSYRVSRGMVKAHSKIVANVVYHRIDGSQVDCVYELQLPLTGSIRFLKGVSTLEKSV